MPYRITQCYLPPGSGDFPAAFTPAETGTRLRDPGGMQSWVDSGGGYIPNIVYRAKTVTYLRNNYRQCNGSELNPEFRGFEVTGVLAWTLNDFCMMKNVCTQNLQLCKCRSYTSRPTKWYECRASDSAFTVNASAQTFGRFGDSSAASVSFSFWMKRRIDVMLVCSLSILCCFGY